jgi:antitoxin component of RelBE/YafQ-DinJ toxin-antitoxin module
MKVKSDVEKIQFKTFIPTTLKDDFAEWSKESGLTISDATTLVLNLLLNEDFRQKTIKFIENVPRVRDIIEKRKR